MSRSPTWILDEPMLLSRVAGNRTLARGLLREFYVTHADVVHRARAALRSGAREDAFRLLHRTAGTAANLGLGQLAAAAGQAEDVLRAALKAGATGPAPDLDTVERCLHEALAEIQAVEDRLAEQDATGPDARQPDARRKDGDGRRRAALLARLVEELNASDLQALDTAAALAPMLGPDAAPLSSALARLDFVEAAGILGGLTMSKGESRCPSSPPPARC